MTKLTYDSPALGRIHARANATKIYAYFTGYLEGVAASGRFETGEGSALLANSAVYLAMTDDPEAEELCTDLQAGIRDAAQIEDVIADRLQRMGHDGGAAAQARFVGLCAGIACDGRLHQAELRAVVAQGRALPDWQDDPAICELLQLCAAGADMVGEGLEIDDRIMEAVSHLAGDSFAVTGLPEIGASVAVSEWIIEDPQMLDRTSFVLTGSFAAKPRSRFSAALQALGMVERSSVNWSTDYLVIGGQPSRDWLEPNRGGKIRLAMQYRERGAPIRFVTEAQIATMLQRSV